MEVPYRYYSGFFMNHSMGASACTCSTDVIVPSIPEEVRIGGGGCTAYLYYGGTFYQSDGSGYVVTVPPAWSRGKSVARRCTTVNINGMSMLQYGNTYYQP